MNTPLSENDPLEALRDLRQSAPPDFVRRVMAALPQEPDQAWHFGLRGLWPESGRWFLPALVGAAATLLLTTALVWPAARATDNRVTVHFEIHAPDAQDVELIGSFTGWQTGRIQLAGPDASGHWTAEVELPAGRHEYGFLVNGREWRSDPGAEMWRSDGFGRNNAVIEL